MSDKINAMIEFLKETNLRSIKCAQIRNEHYSLEKPIIFNLPCNYTPERFNSFLESLYFEYDSGYGAQFLFGNIWYTDGNWSERYEYDGSECWEYKSAPNIPQQLLS